MANKNKSNTGLRFLWIPGRKKHQHKGRMDTTNKQPHYGRPQNRPNEPWALGGSKGHRELIKADNVDAEGVTAASCTTALSVPAVASTVAVAATSDDPNHATDGGEQSSGASAAASCEPSKVTQETHFGPETLDEGATMYPPDLHNTATLLISDRKNGAIRKKIPHSSSGGGDSPALSDIFTASPTLSPIAFPTDTFPLNTTSSANTPPPLPTSSPPHLEAFHHHPLSTSNASIIDDSAFLPPADQQDGASALSLLHLPSAPFHPLRHWGSQTTSSPLPTVIWTRDQPAEGSLSSLNLPAHLWQRDSATSHELHDAQTIIDLSRLQPRKGDLDSIDRLDDDCVDAIKLRNGTTTIKGHTYKEPVEEKENEKTVTCLYYTLQCCECTIS